MLRCGAQRSGCSRPEAEVESSRLDHPKLGTRLVTKLNSRVRCPFAETQRARSCTVSSNALFGSLLMRLSRSCPTTETDAVLAAIQPRCRSLAAQRIRTSTSLLWRSSARGSARPRESGRLAGPAMPGATSRGEAGPMHRIPRRFRAQGARDRRATRRSSRTTGFPRDRSGPPACAIPCLRRTVDPRGRR